MVKMVTGGGRNLLSFWVVMAVEIMFLLSVCSGITPFRKLRSNSVKISPLGVSLIHGQGQVTVDNGLVQVTVSVPDGNVVGIQYNGIDNVLAEKNERDDRGYWDVVWKKSIFDRLATNNFKIVTQTNEQVELSFSKTWRSSDTTVPLNVDKRIIIRQGLAGFYTYSIMERLAGFPSTEMDQIRVVYKLQPNMFNYMAISDNRQRKMPSPVDRDADRSQPLAYKEAVLLTKPTEPDLRGQVDDKYMYSIEDQYNKVHGWITDDQTLGFWMITPSDEFRVGGPIKQDLTSHVGPTVLNMFVSTHYAGLDMDRTYNQGEPWKKVFGPVLVYLNCAPRPDSSALWNDAKRQMHQEVNYWPYNFVGSRDFPGPDQRGQVSGKLVVNDRFVSNRPIYAKYGYVGLADPGAVGSWQTQTKGYQFWTRTDRTGRFLIKNVRPGTYNLYAWVPGVVGDYKLDTNIIITPGSRNNLDVLTYNAPRNGPTLWEIGYPDRTAAEFYIPEPYPTLINPLYIYNERFRQYGLWERYQDIHRTKDLVFTVGVSDPAKDWFYAHVLRNEAGHLQTTTWQVLFQLADVPPRGYYTLQLALAAAHGANLKVWFNNQNRSPDFSTGNIGTDNAIARHGIHGLYRFYSIQVPSNRLKAGTNTIYLSQTMGTSLFEGLMYDYLRLEGPTL